jgi:hypothetical protein
MMCYGYYNQMGMANFALCVVILLLGYIGYKKRGENWAGYIALSFGLFGISHLMALNGMKISYGNAYIAVRILAYLFVIQALDKEIFKK